MLNRMATDNLAKQLSCSWYQPGAAGNPAADQIFQQMAAQGQSFYNASGDNDAYTGLISFPGDTPYLTQVGGTTLTTTGPGGAWVSETVWNRNNGIGSGGGISTQYPIPSWQTNINMTPGQGSTTLRNVPDVALTSEGVYVRANGANYNVGGTSCAAPLWAGFGALINQQAAVSGHAPVGFVTPAIYALGSSPNYTACFHDTTTGNNTNSSSPTKFYAVTGYDLCTGWGTPAGQNLINALANPEALLIAPAAGFVSTGGVGGPFTITSQSFTLTNAGTNSLTWSLVNTSLWLNASPSSGTLTPGGSAATVTIGLNSVASNLLAGTYAAAVWFTNLNDGFGQSRQFTLNIISPPTITTQPADQAVLDGVTAIFSVAATGGQPLSYQWQFNGTNLTDVGGITGSTTTNLTISNVSMVNVGTYAVVASNLAGAVVSSNALLNITPSQPVITLQPASQTAVAGTTANFSVTAIGSKPFFYQWSFNSTNIDGATNGSLTRANVQTTDAGNYAVLISNSHGFTLSSNAVLSVVNIPIITSFSPGAGVLGSNVLITGANFSPVPANNLVYFGAVKAVITAASATNLTVTVPAGATYAPLTVTVNGLTAYSDSPFLPTFLATGTLSSSSLAARVDLASGSGPLHAVVGDLDGDGKPDLVVLNYYDGSALVYRNVSTNGALTTSSFAPPMTLSVPGAGSSVFGLTLADLDGDGRLDVVVGDVTLNRISIFQNQSSPGGLTTNSFGARVDIAVSGQPVAVAVTDVDGDGKTDIVTANGSGNNVSVLRNLSTGGVLNVGSFAAPASFAVGPNPSGIALADLDGDGKPDVVTINQSDINRKVSILRNVSTVGSISFATEVDLAGADTGEKLAVGDLDGDGKPDVVAGSYIGQTVSVYRNASIAGSITTNSFAAPVVFAVGGRVHTVAIGDLDGDGKPDLAAVTELPSKLSLFRNTSTPGSFTTSSLGTRIDFASGNNAVGVAIADLDGDGRPDLAAGNFDDNTVGIYQNVMPFGGAPVIVTQPASSTNYLGTTANFSVTATGSSPLSYQWYFNTNNPVPNATNAILSLNNVQTNQAGTYAVLVTNAYGLVWSSNAVLTVILAPTNVPIITSFSPGAGAAGTNVMITGLNFSPVASGNTVYFGAVKAVVTAASTTNLAVTVPAGATYAPITVTVSGLTAFAPSPFLPTFLSGGSLGSASLAARVDLASGSGPLRVVVGDLDGDGKPDMVVLNYSAGNVYVYRNLSTNGTLAAASFASPVVLPLAGAGSSVFGLALGDLDGDGRLDIVVGGFSLNRVSLFQNISSPGSLTAGSFATPVNIPVSGAPTAVAVADLDADGKPDIITANISGNTVSILKNIGSGGTISAGSFAAPVSFATGINPNNVVVADLDGDGRPDLATDNQSDPNHKVSLLRNLGVVGNISANSFAPAVDLAGADAGETLTAGDLDGDGKPDLVVGSYNGQTLAVYRNTGTPGSLAANSFAAPVVFAVGAKVHTVAVGDLDGNGKPDVAVVTELSSKLSLFRNTSTPGSFTTSSLGTRIDFASGNNAVGVVIADLDGDGRPDLAAGNFGNNTVGIYRNIVPIVFAPTITMQPTNQTVIMTGTATFGLTATGTVSLSYQWKFNTTNIANATNTTLTIPNVQPTNAGNYSVLVTNAYGSVLSSNAMLTVGIPPIITNQPVGQRVSIGCDTAFNIVAGGTGPLAYQWRQANSTINGQTNSNLILHNVQLADFTNYYVIITNMYGSVTSSNGILLQDHPPTTGQDIIQRLATGDVKVKISTLLANDTDADSDTLVLSGVGTNTAAGGTVSSDGKWVYYSPPAGYTNADAFTYTVSDGFCGGIATGNVLVQVTTSSGSSHNFKIYLQPNGSVLLVFAGIPNWTYRIQYADTLPPVNWTDLSTNTADALGVYQYTDTPPPNSPSRFYRSVSP
jgi:hypothetical protein